MQTFEHPKSRLFSLIGRRIVLHVPYYTGYTKGTIAEQIGPARFGVRLDGYAPMVDFHRGEFHLPPLPHKERLPVWLSDDSEGFAYADVPNFNSWRGNNE